MVRSRGGVPVPKLGCVCGRRRRPNGAPEKFVKRVPVDTSVRLICTREEISSLATLKTTFAVPAGSTPAKEIVAPAATCRKAVVAPPSGWGVLMR